MCPQIVGHCVRGNAKKFCSVIEKCGIVYSVNLSFEGVGVDVEEY